MFRKQIVGLVVVLFALLSGCATRDGTYHKEFFERRLSAPKVLVVDPVMQFYEIGVSQQQARRPDLEPLAKADYAKAIANLTKEMGWFKPVTLPSLSEAERYDLDQRMLLVSHALWIYQNMKLMQGSSFSDFSKGMQGQVGPSPALTALANRTGAEYALMTASIDVFTSGGAKALGVVTGVLFLGNAPFKVSGQASMGVGLVELRTGRILWAHSTTGGFDLANHEGQVEGLKKLLKDSPFIKG